MLALLPVSATMSGLPEPEVDIDFSSMEKKKKKKKKGFALDDESAGVLDINTLPPQ